MSDSKPFRCSWCGKEREGYRLRAVGDEIVCDFCLLERAQPASEVIGNPSYILGSLIDIKLVTPRDWERIRADRFVFGYVAAAAFEACECIRIRRDGFVFEIAQLNDSDLEALGNQLDAAAEAAFAMRESLAKFSAAFDAANGVLRV